MAEHRSVNFAPKLITDDGHFSGYGAVFGNLDSHLDVIERGAFAASLASWRSKGRLPPMRLQHGSGGNPFQHDDLAVGKWLAMREDSRGLYVEGKLIAMSTDQGKRLLSLMREGCLDGLSIGFLLRKYTPGAGRTRRILTEIDLRELSLVDEPSNDDARVQPMSDSDAAYDRLRDAFAAATDATTTAPAKSNADTSLDNLRAAMARLDGKLKLDVATGRFRAALAAFEASEDAKQRDRNDR